MGYDLHITRRTHWADPEGPAISAEEWLAVVAADPELRLVPESGLLMALWDGPSEAPEPWLAWSEGEIFTKNPDEPLIRKMVQVAERIGATVQGDDGERYDREGKACREAAPRSAAPSWGWRIAIWMLALLVAMLMGWSFGRAG